MEDDVYSFLEGYDFDVRKTHDARFVDQKCTPDIVCFIADCILNMIATKPVFKIKDLWESQYFVNNSSVIFNKPRANDEDVKHEYDKVLSQPLKLLAYAQSCNDDIAASRSALYGKYHLLIRGNTPTQSDKDITRMFHKVLNVYAAKNGLPGSNGKYPMSYSDTMYNRENWRDKGKAKNMSRAAASIKIAYDRQEAINNYYVQKAMNIVRRIQKCSEVHDSWGNGDATQVHHIFPRSKFPDLAAYTENLILLTATQHFAKAHPNNRTQEINKDYQMVCLSAKADTICESIQRVGEKYYSKESFISVINAGLSADIDARASFKDIKTNLMQLYGVLH